MRLLLIFSIIFLIGCEKEKNLIAPATSGLNLERIESADIGLGPYYVIKDGEIPLVIISRYTEGGYIRVNNINGMPYFMVNHLDDGLTSVLTPLWLSGNLEIAQGHFVKIANNQVLGSQQPAIANSDGSQADNARAINELLEAFRKHGSIDRENQIALSEN